MKNSVSRPFTWLSIIILVFLISGNASFCAAQNNISIDLSECLKLATENYPQVKQKGYLQAIGENNQKGIEASWLPQVNVDFKATYQSEVPSFDFEGFPALTFPKDQYSFGLRVNQTILDGGFINQQKITDQSNTQTEIQKNEVEIYKVRDKVLQLYGNILLTKENIEVLQSYIDDIFSRQNKMASSVRNGLMLQSDLDVLDAEKLKTDQKMIESKSNLTVLCQILSLFMNFTVDENTEFADLPVSSSITANGINRPELTLFSMQKNLINEKIKLSFRKTQPKLSAFADGAYGRPGYNFLNQKMRLYGIAGLALSWNISSLYNLSYDKKSLSIQQQMIEEQKELFELNLNSSLIRENGEIDKLRQTSEIDNSIVDKRKSISRTKANQLDNGTITSSDYLTELNEEKQAILTQKMHAIQLGIAIANLNITTGN